MHPVETVDTVLKLAREETNIRSGTICQQSNKRLGCSKNSVTGREDLDEGTTT